MNTHYTATAKALHWGIALLIFAQLALGVYMTDLELSPAKLQIYAWHKWTGVTLFLLVVVRVVWRIAHHPPALPEHMRRLEQFVAHAGHYLLYVLMLAIPLSGWLMSLPCAVTKRSRPWTFWTLWPASACTATAGCWP